MENQPLQAVWRIRSIDKESESTPTRELHSSDFFLEYIYTYIYTHPTLNWETEKFQICFAAGFANLQVSSRSLKNCHIQTLNDTT